MTREEIEAVHAMEVDAAAMACDEEVERAVRRRELKVNRAKQRLDTALAALEDDVLKDAYCVVKERVRFLLCTDGSWIDQHGVYYAARCIADDVTYRQQHDMLVTVHRF